MITASQMLSAIKKELADNVLPEVQNERAQSSVIAIIGILGELSGHVRDDDDWARESVRQLRDAGRQWGLPVDEAANSSPSQHRSALLEQADRFVAQMWRQGGAEPLIADIRAVLKADQENLLASRKAGPTRGEHSG